MPFPLHFIDAMRTTSTNLENKAEAEIEDYWTTDPLDRELTGSWTGTTSFHILRPEPPSGFIWVDGRLTQKQTTNRVPTIKTEIQEL